MLMKFAAMELSEVISVSGMPGLYKKIGQNKTSLIVEMLDESKKRMPVSLQARISILSEISIYTMDGDVKLGEVFINIKENNIELPEKKADDKEFSIFMGKAVPNFDNERVYLNDMKKLANWYKILKDQIDFEGIKKSLEENSDENESNETKTKESKAKTEKVVKNTNVKSDTKSKGKSVGTIRKMA